MICKGHKMSHSCLSECFATMRLLLNISHLILQCYTVILYSMYSPSESHEHLYDGKHTWCLSYHIGAHSVFPITWSLSWSYRLIFSILTITVQQSHKDARHITYNSCFRSSKFYTDTFSYAIILATVYDPHLHFLV